VLLETPAQLRAVQVHIREPHERGSDERGAEGLAAED
jgi:hypothetical protein